MCDVHDISNCRKSSSIKRTEKQKMLSWNGKLCMALSLKCCNFPLANPLRLRVYPRLVSIRYHPSRDWKIISKSQSNSRCIKLLELPAEHHAQRLTEISVDASWYFLQICKSTCRLNRTCLPPKTKKKSSSARSWNHRANLMKTCVSNVLGGKQEASCNHLATPGF